MKVFLDFDGTVVEHNHPNMGRYNPNSLQVVKKLQDAGHEIILNTYRADIGDESLQQALNLINEQYWMFFNDEEVTMKPIGHLSAKFQPPRFNLKQFMIDGEIFIDDICYGTPLIPAVMTNGKMVDFVRLDMLFERAGLYKPPAKKILYLDLDGVLADFDKAIKKLDPKLETRDVTIDLNVKLASYESRSKLVDELCEANPDIFHNLEPIDGAIEAVDELFELFDVYFLSTPMWNVPESFTGKRIWIHNHFGDKAKKRLVLTHRKDLAIGDILVDDRLKNGAGEFKGEHVWFATEKFPDWETTMNYLRTKV